MLAKIARCLLSFTFYYSFLQNMSTSHLALHWYFFCILKTSNLSIRIVSKHLNIQILFEINMFSRQFFETIHSKIGICKYKAINISKLSMDRVFCLPDILIMWTSLHILMNNERFQLLIPDTAVFSYTSSINSVWINSYLFSLQFSPYTYSLYTSFFNE